MIRRKFFRRTDFKLIKRDHQMKYQASQMKYQASQMKYQVSQMKYQVSQIYILQTPQNSSKIQQLKN